MKSVYTVDATGRTIGRIASEAASMLIGKKLAGSERHILPSVSVTVQNATKVKIPEKKLTDKKYVSYSGYPDGQRTLSLGQYKSKHGIRGVLREAVFGMLPKNKLRAKMIKNLTITD